MTSLEEFQKNPDKNVPTELEKRIQELEERFDALESSFENHSHSFDVNYDGNIYGDTSYPS